MTNQLQREIVHSICKSDIVKLGFNCKTCDRVFKMQKLYERSDKVDFINYISENISGTTGNWNKVQGF